MSAERARASPSQRARAVLPQSPASPAATVGGAAPRSKIKAPPSLSAPRRRQIQERAISMILFAASAVSILTTLGIVGVLIVEASSFFREVSPVEFLTGRRWAPMLAPQS